MGGRWVRPLFGLAIGIALCGTLPPRILAHGPIHEQIETVTREIQKRPGDAELYLKRGELHRLHRDWDAALGDYERAARLDPVLSLARPYRGRMLLEANRPEAAKLDLDRFLLERPDDAEALLARARAQAQLGAAKAAATDFKRAIALLPNPGPEPYVELAQALRGAGLADEALRGLDEGIARLGSIVTLELLAIDLELDLRRYDAALARLDRIAVQSARQETWLARRGEILQRAGRTQEATEAFAAALRAIEALPPPQRRVRALVELEARLRASLGLTAAAER